LTFPNNYLAATTRPLAYEVNINY